MTGVIIFLIIDYLPQYATIMTFYTQFYIGFVMSKKVLVYALLLANNMYVMSMDEKSLVVRQADSAKNIADRIEFLQQNRIKNPVEPIRNFQDAKAFAGHVVLYEIASKTHARLSGDVLSQYGFIFERTLLLPSSFGYELNQLSHPKNDAIAFNFNVNSHALLLPTTHIFMRHLTPSEAADLLQKIKRGDIACGDSTRYSQAIMGRLNYRAQQEADEAPNLHVISTKENVKKLLLFTPEQAENDLKDMQERDYFDYYISGDEQRYIEDLLRSVIVRDLKS